MVVVVVVVVFVVMSSSPDPKLIQLAHLICLLVGIILVLVVVFVGVL